MFCKWNLSLVLSLLVSLTSISTADAVGSVPEPVGVYQRPPPIDEQEQCVPFHHHYCSKFGYSQTISPNPWARDLTLEQATNEFSDFNDLLRRNCSDKLGTFLCFTYFPLCYKQPSAGERRLILPCKETCEAVHNSECNDLVMGSVGEWGKHLQCSNFHTKTETENGNCADGQQKVWTDSSTENKGGDGMKKEDVVPPMVLSKETTENCGGESN